MVADLAVLAKDFPETILIAEVKERDLAGQDQDRAVEELAKYMWRTHCHYGLLITPTQTHILRDTFEGRGPSSIHLTNTFDTPTLLAGRSQTIGWPSGPSHRELETLAREWLGRLTTDYEEALTDDPEITRALFPEIVSAVADGRVVAEASV